jgi:hypothetical protein
MTTTSKLETGALIYTANHGKGDAKTEAKAELERRHLEDAAHADETNA